MTADDVSAFSGPLDHVTSQEQLYLNGSTCQTYIVRVYGKLHFKKQLKAEYKGMPQYVEAFRKEFEVGYRLNHPALPCYVALGDEDGCPYILEEYIDGDTLTDFLAANPCYFHSRLHADRLIDELLSVFSYLHHHQVLFLDLKPDNVMITSVDRHYRPWRLPHQLLCRNGRNDKSIRTRQERQRRCPIRRQAVGTFI